MGFSMFRRAVDLFTPDAVLPGFDRLKGVSLFPHQADGVAFLLSKRRAILGSGPQCFFGNIKVFDHDVLFHRLPYHRK